MRKEYELDRPAVLIRTPSKRPAAMGDVLRVRFDDSSWPAPVVIVIHHGLGSRDRILENTEIRGWTEKDA